MLMKRMIIDDRNEDENEDQDEDDKFEDEEDEILWMKKPGHLDAPGKWKKPPPV